jgi:ABC-type proline/glycine betaine transport system permease subunit
MQFRTPLAWKNLTHDVRRLMVAVSGVAFAVILIFMELGFLNALLESTVQVLRRLEMPLAAPLIVTGIRTAAVQVIATATLAALIGGGGLGRFIVDGFAQGDEVMLMAGAILVALLAIVSELVFGGLARLARPRLASAAAPA